MLTYIILDDPANIGQLPSRTLGEMTTDPAKPESTNRKTKSAESFN